jgi:hypothetical protein
MKKKIAYTNEPQDGLELPENGFQVIPGALAAEKWKSLSTGEGDYEKQTSGRLVRMVPKRGGARSGAGRKPLGNVRMQLSISLETRKKIEGIAKRKQITLSRAVEELAAAI